MRQLCRVGSGRTGCASRVFFGERMRRAARRMARLASVLVSLGLPVAACSRLGQRLLLSRSVSAPSPCSPCIGGAVCCVGWQISVPPHSLHLERCILCWQMRVPQHSLQLERCKLCWQMPVPPHSLQLWRCKFCWQMLVPPHSLLDQEQHQEEEAPWQRRRRVQVARPQA
jgi:hypothetical protein